jgi:hypothetical protein
LAIGHCPLKSGPVDFRIIAGVNTAIAISHVFSPLIVPPHRIKMIFE